MIHRISAILLFLLLITDLYIYRVYICQLTVRRCLRFAWWIPSLLLVIFFCSLLVGDNFTPARITATSRCMTLYLLLTIPKTLFVLCSLIGSTVMRVFGKSVQKIIVILSSIVAFGGVVLIGYGSTIGWHRFEVKEVEFFHPDVPSAFDGYRIVHISDWHIGTIAGHPERIIEAIDIVNAQHPDLVVFTGDLVNNEVSELDGKEHIFNRIKATDGVISILGNHDYGTYRQWETKQAELDNLNALKEWERKNFGRLLLNEKHLIAHAGDTIAIIGVENDGNPPFPSLGDLPKAMEGTAPYFKILLSHDPTHWRRRVLPDTDIPLTLSGHTHAMQFRIGNWSPSAWFYPEWSGFYYDGLRALYVNQGLGGAMLAFRFGAWPEITVHTLRRSFSD